MGFHPRRAAAEGRVRLVVGGGHPLVLRAAARYGDVAGLSGLGRTLPDGHYHQVRWSPFDLSRQLRIIREEALRAGNTATSKWLLR